MTYLDHAATTPPRPEARAALLESLDAANASGTHAAGQRARAAVEQAREEVAATLGCSPHEIIFTSGGTEADNLSIKGIVWAARDRTRATPHVVVSRVEHAAVLESVRWLADRGDITVSMVAPEADGRVDVERVAAAITPHTMLVSVMAANNEIGAVNDIAALAAAVDGRAAIHTDAVQMFATRPVPIDDWAVDALALSAHKFGGPQGVGVAFLRRGVGVEPIAHGGGQDRGVRSGTFAAGLIAACGAACVAANDDRERVSSDLERFNLELRELFGAIAGVTITGPESRELRLASHVHLLIEGIDAAALTLELDRAGIAASPGSACGSGAAKASHVVEAIGGSGTPLRLSMGWTTTSDDIAHVCGSLPTVIERLRAVQLDNALALRPIPGVG